MRVTGRHPDSGCDREIVEKPTENRAFPLAETSKVQDGFSTSCIELLQHQLGMINAKESMEIGKKHPTGEERIESMAMKIRLTRMGSKKRPCYRVVAVDSETRRDGRALDFLGYYNPMKEPAEIKLDADKVKAWLAKGAKPTDTVRSLLTKAGINN
jgi:small subunit ribosomal protein S16